MTHPYTPFLHKVEKPARYVGGEYLQVQKDPDTVDVSLCLAFPDIYDIGMSHMGTKILYRVLNDDPMIAAERAFAPWPDMEAELRARDLPILSLENARPLADFDAIGFSLQYEMTFTNVLNILDLSGIPLRSADRDEDCPLILAGGPVATHPEPIAPFIDAFLIGDAEEKLPLLLKHWKRLCDEGLPRRDRLAALARSGGIYVPSLYDRALDERSGLMVVSGPAAGGDAPMPVVREFVEDLSKTPFPDDSPEPVAEAIFDRMSLEIARGCTEGCRFCQAGMIYRPVRERTPDEIVDTLVSAVEKGGYNEASLTSLSTADYSCISPLIKRVMSKLRDRQVSLSVSSLRAYGLADETLDELRTGRAAGLTFAPEAGTQRMRDVVNKNVTEDDIIESAHRVFSKGWTRMKLYFMIGLPTEENEDVVGIVETGARVRDVGTNYHPRRFIQTTVSVSSHVPKPHTPFQWCAMDGVGEILRKQSLLSEHAREQQLKVKWHNHRISHLEGIVARGDCRVADVVELAWKKGARFDGWDEHLRYGVWIEAIKETGLDPSLYLGTLPVDGGLPWDHIDVGLEDGFLRREYRRAMRDKLSPPCGKPVWEKVHHTNLLDARAEERKLVCYNCGVACDMEAMRTDRIEYLEALDAHEPPKTAPSIETLVALGQATKGNRPRPPARPPQGKGTRHRLTYTKLGPVRLTSHLDLVRRIPRIFRRAKIALKNSEGYNPKPLMSYAPALPLGVWSLNEVLEVQLLQEIDLETLVARLNTFAPHGLQFTGARKLDDHEPGLGHDVVASEYLVACPDGTDLDALGEKCAALLAATEWLAERTSRKSGRRMEVDIRPIIEALEITDSSPLAQIEEADLTPTSAALRMVIRFNGTAFIRADELAANLLGVESLDPPFVLRTRLIAERDGTRSGVLACASEPPMPIPMEGTSVALSAV